MELATLLTSIGILLVILVIVLIITAIWAFIFWILMIIDAAKRDLPENEKVVWLLVIILLHALGAAIYYFAVKRPLRK